MRPHRSSKEEHVHVDDYTRKQERKTIDYSRACLVYFPFFLYGRLRLPPMHHRRPSSSPTPICCFLPLGEHTAALGPLPPFSPCSGRGRRAPVAVVVVSCPSWPSTRASPAAASTPRPCTTSCPPPGRMHAAHTPLNPQAHARDNQQRLLRSPRRRPLKPKV